MLGIIVYGSLINTTESAQSNDKADGIIPIKTRQLRRIFNQRPRWRTTTSQQAAVLSIHPDQNEWFNGICYCYSTFDFSALDQRERGYVRTTLSSGRITPYPGYQLPDLDKVHIYLGREEQRDDTLLPHPQYLDICLNGARDWGQDFYDDFLDTTYVRNEIQLRRYIDGHQA